MKIGRIVTRLGNPKDPNRHLPKYIPFVEVYHETVHDIFALRSVASDFRTKIHVVMPSCAAPRTGVSPLLLRESCLEVLKERTRTEQIPQLEPEPSDPVIGEEPKNEEPSGN